MKLDSREWPVWAMMLIVAIPYLMYVFKMPICGYDCARYVWDIDHRSITELGRVVEPLYYMIAKPISLLFDGIVTVKIVSVIMLFAGMVGMSLLGRRLDMSRWERAMLIGLWGLSATTFRVWGDLLRNFTMYAILPYFLYWYLGSEKRDRIKSYVTLGLMFLAHRTVILLIPAMILSNIIQRRWKRLGWETILFYIPVPIIYWLVQNGSPYGLYGYAFEESTVPFIPDIGVLMLNISIIKIMIPILTLMGLAGAYMVWKDGGLKKNALILTMAGVLLGLSVLMGHNTAYRSVHLMTLPLAVLSVMAFRLMGKTSFSDMGKFVIVGLSITSMVLGGFWVLNAPSGVSLEEERILNDLDIPEGSRLVVHGRLYWYAVWLHGDRYEIRYCDVNSLYRVRPMTEECAVYLQHNVMGDVYYLMGDPNISGLDSPAQLGFADSDNNHKIVYT